ncbi:unnamed protein product [Clonostachys solani]|uniref:CCHC-type domain-containing protein n=1 Tax=Clonostachys solani TaxID=160281 RepID=A0A9P0EJS0_9HYPO|nr:unnamed protein product [Clonostachys solani]
MADHQGGYPKRPEEASCVNCGGSGHWAIACPEPTREVTAGFEAWRSSSHGGQRSGKDHNRGGNRRPSAPIITRYGPQSTQDLSNFPPPGYNPGPPAPYPVPFPAQTHEYAPPPPPADQGFPQYPPPAHYPPAHYPAEYPPGYQISLPEPVLPPSYGPPPPGHQLTHVPPGTNGSPPTMQAHLGGYQPQVPATLYPQVSGSYPPLPPPVYTGPPGLAQAPGRFEPPTKPNYVHGGSDKHQFNRGSKPRKQAKQAPQQKPLPSGEGLAHALPPKPPIKKLPPAYLHPSYLSNLHPGNQNRLDWRRSQRSQKQQERDRSNRERGNQNGGANNRRNSSHRKQNVSNKSNSPRFRKRSGDGASAEDAKSVTTTEASPARLEPEDKSNEASTPLKTPEPELKDEKPPTEGGSSNQEVTEPHDQEKPNVADQPKENSDDVKDASVNSESGDVKPLPSDDPATELVSNDTERAETVEKDFTAIPEQEISADKPCAEQECSEEANSEAPDTVEEPIDRQDMGRKRKLTNEEDDSPQERPIKRQKSSEAEGLQPKEPLQVNETNNGPQSSEDSSLPVPLEEQLPSNRRDSILSGGSRPASRRSSVSSRSSGLDSLEAELLGRPSKEKSKTETKEKKKKTDGRGTGKKRQPKVNSAYSRRW